MVRPSASEDPAGRASDPDWERDTQKLLARLPPILGSAATKEALQFLERQCKWAVRYGSDRKSPVVSMLGHVGNYWCSAILLFLRVGPLRPSQLRSIINTAPTPPISKRMMTLNLRLLERDGLIEREVYDSRLAHVEYRLTDIGFQLSDLSIQITEWGVRNAEMVLSARQKFDAQDDSYGHSGSRF
jgi:DNA-binding HxlR family transcriptional regulator